jgi:hypothetical protein
MINMFGFGENSTVKKAEDELSELLAIARHERFKAEIEALYGIGAYDEL